MRLTPARHASGERGVVEFHVWPVNDDIRIEGANPWRRPVTGRTADNELIVRHENGTPVTLSVYLDTVMPRELQADHSNRGKGYMRNADGPIGDAPKITKRGCDVSAEDGV